MICEVIEIGASLAQARVRRGVGLEEAATATRLREHYLRALEQDEFDQLPPSSYRIAFLRAYADFLELDSDRLVDEYTARYEHARMRHQPLSSITAGKPRRRRRR
jgi:cytoskeletal protein RodZ